MLSVHAWDKRKSALFSVVPDATPFFLSLLTPDLRPGLMHGAQKNTVCFETLMRGKDEMSGASPIVLNTKEMLLEILDRGEHLNMV